MQDICNYNIRHMFKEGNNRQLTP